jgi:hypothetical protein
MFPCRLQAQKIACGAKTETTPRAIGAVRISDEILPGDKYWKMNLNSRNVRGG